MLRLPSHLFTRSGVYYFRIVVPTRLRPVFKGRPEFCYSLRVKDLKPALTISRILSLQAERIFFWSESLLMAYKQDPDKLGFIVKYNPKDGLYVESDPGNPEDGAQALAALQQLAPVIVATEQTRPVIDRDVVLREMNLANALSGIQPVTSQSSRLFSVILDNYMKVHSSKWNSRTAKDYLASIQQFIDTVGDMPVQSVSKRTVNDYKVAMSETKMAPTTLDKKLIAIKGALDYAISTGDFVGGNPFTGQLVLKKRDKRKRPSYKEFTSGDLKKIFGEDYFGFKKDKPHFFWVPLIGLFTGARINEICQLRCNEILEYEGTWIISMLAEEDDQKAKTEASQRIVPIHSKLLELGLVEYARLVKRVTGDATSMLFPYLVKDKTGYSKSSSRQFGIYLDRLKITDPYKVFHSFRITANSRLRQAGVDEEKRCQLVGHMHDTVNSQVYSSPLEAKKLAETVLDKLQYPEVDFGLLKPDMAVQEVKLRRELERRASMQSHKESMAARLGKKTD